MTLATLGWLVLIIPLLATGTAAIILLLAAFLVADGHPFPFQQPDDPPED